MAFLKFSDDAAMYDSTPLDNLFIIENLPTAPEAFLKVYIYARMLCMHPELGGMEELARALRLSEEIIANAMTYWEREGFVRRVADNPPEYVLLPVRGNNMTELDRDYYIYRDFNSELQAIFPEGMVVHGAQYSLANDWMTTLGFSQEAVLSLVRHTAERSRSKQPNPASVFKTADKKAAQLADRGITDLEGVEREFARDERSDRIAREVLTQMGLRRNPTEPELKLLNKWLNEWDCAEEELLAACEETVKAQNPSFAYLDKILENRRDSGETFERVKTLLDKLGSRQKPTKKQCQWYEALMEEGFDPETVALAAEQQSRRSNPSFEGLEFFLSRWREKGLYAFSAAQEYVNRNLALLMEFTDVLRSAGIEKKPTEDDLVAFEGWKKALPMEVIRFGAEKSAGRSYPVSYLKNLLDGWIANGVTTLAAAQASADTPPRRMGESKPKTNPALDYEQREYSNEQFDRRTSLEEARKILESMKPSPSEN